MSGSTLVAFGIVVTDLYWHCAAAAGATARRRRFSAIIIAGSGRQYLASYATGISIGTVRVARVLLEFGPRL